MILNKRTMCHFAHLRNQFKLVNTFEKSYNYIITLIRRGKNPFTSFLRIEWFLFEKKLSFFTHGYLMPNLVETGPVILEKIFKISSMYFCYFTIISRLKRAGPFIWTNLGLLHRRMLRAKFGWNWSCGSWEEGENVKGSRQ